MKDEDLIHLKFNYLEAVQSKRNILEFEQSLLKILKALKNYHSLRIKELELKLLLYKEIKSFKLNNTKLKKTIPKLKIPEILKKENLEEDNEEKNLIKEKEIQKEKIIKYDNSLDSQLREIQDKLRSLQE